MTLNSTNNFKENISHLLLFKLGKWNNRHLFKDVKKATKGSLKTTGFLLDAYGHIPKFDIYQGQVAFNCFKRHANSWSPDFF